MAIENIASFAKNKQQTSANRNTALDISRRMRRNRTNAWVRDMVAESRITAQDLIWPAFIIEGSNDTQKINTMPGVERYSIDVAVKMAKEAEKLSIPAIALFPITENHLKDNRGTEALNNDNLVCRAVREIKDAVPEIGIITDVALDPYTDHGHDGVLQDKKIINDETVGILCTQAVNQAKAGADIIAPSDMMDGRVAAIRSALDTEGYEDVKILSYAAKYASCFYGPFRDAVCSNGCLQGDKKTYQMNPANSDEAIHEVELDIQEGADMVMIKPGMPYLDIIRRVKETFMVPTMAYQVSGEFAMLNFAAQNGAFDYQQALMESLLCFKRAGADGILSYGALDVAKTLQK